MAYLVFPDLSKSELHNQLGPSVREMLRFRAAYGVPITCMRNGSAVGNKAEWDRGSDELLRGLVATYLAGGGVDYTF
ncbi:hypothetical protein PENSPDRAFT_659855 [Peniophora sp. CONT]|nr:hypothetical protein PENSPDRAFT_659855 [Peniophora sp. CONT]